MQWIIENWLLLLVGGGMIAMHLFGHGHGRKGGGHGAHGEPEKKPKAADPEAADRSEKSPHD